MYFFYFSKAISSIMFQICSWASQDRLFKISKIIQNFDYRYISGHVLLCTQNCHLNPNSTPKKSLKCELNISELSFRRQRIFITFQKVFVHLPLDKICHEYLFDQCNLQPVGPGFHVFLDEFCYLARHLEKSLILAWFNNRSKLFLNLNLNLKSF